MGFQFDRSDVGLLVTLGLIVLSARLLRLFLRTRRLPELLVAIYFLVAPLGISLSIRVTRMPSAPPAPSSRWRTRRRRATSTSSRPRRR